MGDEAEVVQCPFKQIKSRFHLIKYIYKKKKKKKKQSN